MCNVLEVTGIVQANGGDEVAVAVVLLHDAIEDQRAETRERIREKLRQQVFEIIEACTESDTFPKSPWQERKKAYVNQVETVLLPTLLVIVADKLQNSRASLRRLKYQGAERCGNTGLEEKLRFKQSLLEAMCYRLTHLERETDHPMLVSLHLLIDEYAEVAHSTGTWQNTRCASGAFLHVDIMPLSTG